MSEIPSTDEALANLSMPPLLDAMMTQRAIRRVKPDPVDDAIVIKCIELALRAPHRIQRSELGVHRRQRPKKVKDQLGKRYRQPGRFTERSADGRRPTTSRC